MNDPIHAPAVLHYNGHEIRAFFAGKDCALVIDDLVTALGIARGVFDRLPDRDKGVVMIATHTGAQELVVIDADALDRPLGRYGARDMRVCLLQARRRWEQKQKGE